MPDLDYYRCLTDSALLATAREEGINADIAVVMAERLEGVAIGETTGGRYTFKHRSKNA